MRVWIDIENPPQVQYLVPLVRAFKDRGNDVLVTARDHTMTFELLRSRGEAFRAVGHAFGRTKLAKVNGLARRAQALVSLFKQLGRPDALIAMSRPAAVAARWMRVPSFIICDYEHVHLQIYRLIGSSLLFPDAIEPSAFAAQGFPSSRLVAFPGLKEDITFLGVTSDDVDPYAFPELCGQGLTRVLFRPPAEESHYFSKDSRTAALACLKRLADEASAVVIYSPRYEWQTKYLDRFEWRNEPIVLERALPFLTLLRSVDLVIASGGTMAREAAFFGLPAYSIFQGPTGGVDRHLESKGRLRIIRSAADLAAIDLRRVRPQAPLTPNPLVLETIVSAVSARVGR